MKGKKMRATEFICAPSGNHLNFLNLDSKNHQRKYPPRLLLLCAF